LKNACSPPANFKKPHNAGTTQDTAGMASDLKRIYFSLLLPAVAGYIAVFALQYFHLIDWNISDLPPQIPPFVFIISVCFAVAFPILYRTVFANKMRHHTHTTEEEWLKFERNLLYIAMTTPYVSLISQILRLPRFHLGAVIIMALYAVYYYYPSKKRINYERRIFRVKT
jgi:hypothetical protein